MASYHLSVKTIKRSAGRSATAAAAYRSASLILCDREGRVHDYSRKAGVEHAVILAPEEAPDWARDRAALWNAAEARETRSNSVTAREWELALPAELDAEERRVLVLGFVRELVSRYGVAADVAIHAPHRDGDQRNHHAHVLTTTRVLTAEGLTDKTRVLDAKATGGPEIEAMRARWAELQNHALERQGHEVRVDHRSLAVQREAALEQGDALKAEEMDREAEVKLGPATNAIERREMTVAELEGRDYAPLTQRGARVYAIRQAKALFADMRERLELARETWTHTREEGADLVTAGLAALRAAAQRHGLEREHGVEVAEPTLGDAVEADSIGERLARIVGRDVEADGFDKEAERDSIRDRLQQVLGRDTLEPAQDEEHALEAERARQRQLELHRQHERDRSLDREL